MLYFIKPAPADSTPEWEKSPEEADTLRRARQIRTQVAQGIGLPNSAVAIYNQKGVRVE